MEGFSQGLFGKLYGDRGYISKALREKLGSQGISLVYKVRKNMAPLPMSETDSEIPPTVKTNVGIRRSLLQEN